jgi:hypothetical protein
MSPTIPIPSGGDSMAIDSVGDMDIDIAEQMLEETAGAHTALMTEARGNASSAHSIVRHSAARKFNQEDPIEAAAAEMILQPNAQ